MPTMMMGSAAVFIDCDESWKLFLVTRKGSLYVWDLFNMKCLLHDSLASLVTADPRSTAKDAGNLILRVWFIMMCCCFLFLKIPKIHHTDTVQMVMDSMRSTKIVR